MVFTAYIHYTRGHCRELLSLIGGAGLDDVVNIAELWVNTMKTVQK